MATRFFTVECYNPHRPAFMIYRSILRPILFQLSPETAHELALNCLCVSLRARSLRDAVASRYKIAPFGKLNRFGLEFDNPLGLAAGFDKNGRAADALSSLGFGFIEVGTVTSQPQTGNEKPRLFRLPADHALINRLGFNNCGASELVENIRRHRPDCVLGVNIGKSRRVPIEDATADYLATFETVYDVADYIVVNVSSPNTPNLRELQRQELLSELLGALQERNRSLALAKSAGRKPLLVKIAPDLSETALQSIIEVALAADVAGVIATNTTVSRDGLLSDVNQVNACGEGGLSGAPLRSRSTEVISTIYRATKGTLPIIGSGGVFNANDAWEKIISGASLIQIYTGFIYEGPGVARRINEELGGILQREGFSTLDDAIGCAVR
ncbi:MAG TPA: quinone-dependent dihydroorotate dehydrogenase [Pyrinomonadaceae bacterium]|nr:quinone-dependent dihydroorotate dehydrogenase [Pyrinomonadaceae bacterium]